MDNQKLKDKKDILDVRNSLIVQENTLLRKTRFSLSTVEMKILIFAISKIKAEDTELNTIEIELKEFFEVVGIEPIGSAYNYTKSIIKKLSDKSYWLKTDKDTEVLFRWISEAEIKKRDGTIKLKLGKQLEPFLVELRKNFTSYNLINILPLRSSYSIRLYQLFKSYCWLSYWEVSIEELKDILDVKNKYSNYRDFKNKIIYKSIEQINELTDLDIEIEEIKTGRQITHLYFKIYEKQGAQMLMPMLEKQKERLG